MEKKNSFTIHRFRSIKYLLRLIGYLGLLSANYHSQLHSLPSVHNTITAFIFPAARIGTYYCCRCCYFVPEMAGLWRTRKLSSAYVGCLCHCLHLRQRQAHAFM
ncbi:uncharacterized protein F4807DRAFT_93086 [Annulohypoxylon truncatum]|uniref:uncharacterized protein n=1 Tax=Annulohypoxylon truncatum TaxID=327061 RepID=UPI00200809FF|nr:uncharacterized protein F4807DRAFT_93086 [Annulohypoxylon truncatum]KAI1209426.1 hypothetical protein F4807DRAFT_93086 [Annulohypoxylon truncatum]